MKKVLSFILLLSMLLGLCAVSAQAEDITIAVSILSSTDTLGSEVKRLLDSTAEALGVKVIYVDQAHISSGYASAETLAMAAATHDHLQLLFRGNSFVINTSTKTNVWGAVLPVINRKQTHGTPGQVLALLCGHRHESEPDNGKRLVQSPAKGRRKIGRMGWRPGDATFLAAGKATRPALKSGTPLIPTIRRAA